MVIPAFLTGRAGAAVHELESARSSAMKMSLYLDDIGDGGSSALYVPVLNESFNVDAHLAKATPALRDALGAKGAATFLEDVGDRQRQIKGALTEVGGPTNEFGELPGVLAAERVADGLMHSIEGQVEVMRAAAKHTATTRASVIGAVGLAGAATGAVTLHQTGGGLVTVPAVLTGAAGRALQDMTHLRGAVARAGALDLPAATVAVNGARPGLRSALGGAGQGHFSASMHVYFRQGDTVAALGLLDETLPKLQHAAEVTATRRVLVSALGLSAGAAGAFGLARSGEAGDAPVALGPGGFHPNPEHRY